MALKESPEGKQTLETYTSKLLDKYSNNHSSQVSPPPKEGMFSDLYVPSSRVKQPERQETPPKPRHQPREKRVSVDVATSPQQKSIIYRSQSEQINDLTQAVKQLDALLEQKQNDYDRDLTASRREVEQLQRQLLEETTGIKHMQSQFD